MKVSVYHLGQLYKNRPSPGWGEPGGHRVGQAGQGTSATSDILSGSFKHGCMGRLNRVFRSILLLSSAGAASLKQRRRLST